MDIIFTHTNGGEIYDACYQLASISSFILFVWIGIRRRYAIHNWLLICTTAFLFCTIGLHLGTFSIADWNMLFVERIPPPQTGKTELGALIGFIIGIWLSQKVIRTHYPVLDIFAFIIPVTLIIQRIGCLFAGCCFGLPTESVFGVQYGTHFTIFEYQQISDLLPIGAEQTLPVHSIPVYLILVHLFVLAGVYLLRNQFKKSGSLFAFSIAVNAVGRFFVEFLRDPVTNHQLGETWYGVKHVQWILLVICVIATLTLLIRERQSVNKTTWLENYGIKAQIYFSFCLLLIAFSFAFLLNTLERTNIILRLICLSGALTFVIVRKKYYVKPELAIALLPFFLLIGMSQTTKGRTLRKEKPKIINQYGTHEIGASYGSYNAINNTYRTERQNNDDGCTDYNSILVKTEEKTSIGSYGYAYNHYYVKANDRTSNVGFGINYTPIRNEIYLVEQNRKNTETINGFAVAGFYGVDKKDVGYRIGFWLGDMYGFRADNYGTELIEKKSFPIFALRLGNMNTAFFHGSIGDDYVHGIYRYQGMLKVGVNLTPNAHLNQHISLGYTSWGQGVLEGDFNLSPHLTLKPSIYLKHSIPPTKKHKPNYGLGIRYTPNPNK
jgi:phosphatidylglycerol:prolipoprotein diacylglycerol transferase